MALYELNLNVDAGATYPAADGPIQFFLTNADDSVYSLTGYTGKMQIRKNASDTAYVVQVVPTISSSTGCVSFSIPAASTAVLTDGPYVWALELYPPSPATDPVIRLAEGRVVVSAEVVR